MKIKKRTAAILAALGLVLTAAHAVSASEIRIISEESESEAAPDLPVITQGQAQAGALNAETEQEEEAGHPLDPSEEGISAADAISGARTLYSQMQHYADVSDNTNFAALFENGADAQTIQSQLQQIKSSLVELRSLHSHSDYCFFDPTSDSTQSPYYFAVALCDYDVDAEGACAWYSSLMRVAKYPDGWKASVMSAGELLLQHLPQEYRDAQAAGRNCMNLYASFALPYKGDAVFDGAFYALPCLVWQDENGDMCCAVWLANGTQSTKWCDSADLIASDSELGDVTAVNVPVQIALESGQSMLSVCRIPAEYVGTGTKEWTDIRMNSDLKYQ